MTFETYGRKGIFGQGQFGNHVLSNVGSHVAMNEEYHGGGYVMDEQVKTVSHPH